MSLGCAIGMLVFVGIYFSPRGMYAAIGAAVLAILVILAVLVLIVLVLLVILIVLFAVHGGASFRADEDCLVCMVENYASDNKKDEPEDACSQRMSVYNVRPACAGGYADQGWNH